MSTFSEIEKEFNTYLKITILREEKKVLFAEGNKEFVDGLFGYMLFPTSAVLQHCPEAIPGLYNIIRSIKDMPDYFIPLKELLLNAKPESRRASYEHVMFVKSESQSSKSQSSGSLSSIPLSTMGDLFVCGVCVHNPNLPVCVAEDSTVLCLHCNKPMTKTVEYNNTPSERMNADDGGFVQSQFKYFITDRLEIQPLITLSNATKVLTALSHKVVEEVTIDKKFEKMVMEELLKKASLNCSGVLSKTFFETGLLERITGDLVNPLSPED